MFIEIHHKTYLKEVLLVFTETYFDVFQNSNVFPRWDEVSLLAVYKSSIITASEGNENWKKIKTSKILLLISIGKYTENNMNWL